MAFHKICHRPLCAVIDQTPWKGMPNLKDNVLCLTPSMLILRLPRIFLDSAHELDETFLVAWCIQCPPMFHPFSRSCM